MDESMIREFIDNVLSEMPNCNNWLIDGKLSAEDDYSIRCLWIIGIFGGIPAYAIHNLSDPNPDADAILDELKDAIRALEDNEKPEDVAVQTIAMTGWATITVLAKGRTLRDEDFTVIYGHPTLSKAQCAWLLKASADEQEEASLARN